MLEVLFRYPFVNLQLFIILIIILEILNENKGVLLKIYQKFVLPNSSLSASFRSCFERFLNISISVYSLEVTP